MIKASGFGAMGLFVLFVLFVVIVVIVASAPVAAQCTTQWTAEFAPAVGGGPHGVVNAMLAFDDGNGPALFMAGDFTGVSIVPNTSGVVRWNGQAFSSVGGGIVVGGSLLVRDLCVFDDGGGEALFAAGQFNSAGGVTVDGVARWDGSAWSDVASLAGDVDDLCVWNDGTGAALYASGHVSVDGRMTFHELVKWDGTSGSVVCDTNGWPYVMRPWDDGTCEALFAGGRFTVIDGVAAELCARFDGTTWTPLSSGIQGVDFPRVRDMLAFDDGGGEDLYLAGRFLTAGGVACSNIARWDGSGFSALGSGIVGGLGAIVEALAVFDDPINGPELWAAGDFATAGGVACANVARWNGSAWGPAGSGSDQYAVDLCAFPEQAGADLFLGGGFSTIGGNPTQKLGRWRACHSDSFCEGSVAACPCGNGGAADAGCDNAQGTGGAKLGLASFTPDGVGGGTATFVGSGFPPASAPVVLLIRARHAADAATFGDGLLCLQANEIVRLQARVASGAATTHGVAHGAGAGTFAYQLWYRNTPASFCDVLAAFNTSNGYVLTWP